MLKSEKKEAADRRGNVGTKRVIKLISERPECRQRRRGRKERCAVKTVAVLDLLFEDWFSVWMVWRQQQKRRTVQRAVLGTWVTLKKKAAASGGFEYKKGKCA